MSWGGGGGRYLYLGGTFSYSSIFHSAVAFVKNLSYITSIPVLIQINLIGYLLVNQILGHFIQNCMTVLGVFSG